MQDKESLEEIKMMNLHAVLVDLDRCVGCQTCEVACKQENGLKEGETWIEVITIGPEEVGGKLCADYYPVINGGCQFCSQRTSQGLDPFCVAACPTKALKFCSLAGILVALRSKKRYQICGVKQGQ
jgi:Fe-S-cluster-containing dehydrogenase component